MTPLTVPRRLSSHLFMAYSEFPHRDSGNVYLLTGRVPTLIDCGSRSAVPRLLRNLAQIGLDLSDIPQVIATHGDCDHIQGYHDLHQAHPGMRLYLHPADWSLAQEANPYRNAGYLYRNSFHPIAPERCLPLTDGGTVPAGDGELTVIHTPGHTEGSVCLWGEVDGRHVLFAGDTVGGAMRSLQGADLAIWAQAARTWEESLQRIAQLPIDWILNGHEPEDNLPLPRGWLDRGIETFGMMMNPWFFLDASDEEPFAPEAAQGAG